MHFVVSKVKDLMKKLKRHFLSTDTQSQQLISTDDKLSKTKALWMKVKKELETSKKAEGELQVAMAALKLQLEEEKQQAEQSKVSNYMYVHVPVHAVSVFQLTSSKQTISGQLLHGYSQRSKYISSCPVK